MATAKHIFTYAIISDTHMRPEGGDESSPWEVNKYANARARWVIDRINRSDPEFVVHMGDIVHPFPHLSTYDTAADAALKAHGKLNAPVFYLPGNHDVGDKKNPMMPADAVDDYGLNAYARRFGALYQSFDHRGFHFVLINAQAFNSGLAHEKEHAEWLEADLAANSGKRIHLFTHYPPYVLEPAEPGNYDNIDEPARSRLLRLLEQHRIEVLFAGHVHHFIYQKYGSTDCYNLFATSFVRQDYAEMFRIEAADEYGRNDAEKLGWCIVDVYEDTHIARIYRSNGEMLDEKNKPKPVAPKINTYHPRDNVLSPMGVHLRHPWAEIIELPYNGPLDEFIRKRVRNDYTLLGLWECGIQKIRVPLSDVLDETIRARMTALTELGHRFTVFSCGVPTGSYLETLKQHQDMVDVYEIVVPWRDLENLISDLKTFRKAINAPLFLANIESSADLKHEGSKFSHFVSYGFRMSHTERIDAFLDSAGAAGLSDGFVFRISTDESPWKVIPSIGAYASEKGLRAVTNIRLASENPAEFLADDLFVSNRIAETMVSAAATHHVDAFIDTFLDLDRGYFPRIGIYDRRYNRRPGSYVFAHMVGVINDYGPDITLGEYREDECGRTCVFESATAAMNLFLPVSGSPHLRKTAIIGKTDPGNRGRAKLVDLVSGCISEVEWRKSGEALILASAGPSDVPSIFVIEK